MKFKLLHNLGTTDAQHCNKECGASLSLDATHLKAGSEIELPQKAVDYLTVARKLVNLLGTPGKVTGEAKKPELTAPAK
jgi:hypothetical protein